MEFLQFGIIPGDRSWLHEQIEQRFDNMLKGGLLCEVNALYERGDLHPGMPSIRAVGYAQVWELLAGRVSELEMREQGIAATRQLAKRQLTWLRAGPSYTFFRPAPEQPIKIHAAVNTVTACAIHAEMKLMVF